MFRQVKGLSLSFIENNEYYICPTLWRRARYLWAGGVKNWLDVLGEVPIVRNLAPL